MGLRFDPVGGGQFKAAIKQIMEAESQPLKQLEARKQREEAKLKLFQEFKGKFTNLDRSIAEVNSFKKLRELKVDMGDAANFVSVTLDKDKASPGIHSIQIDELASRSAVMSNGFEDPDEPAMGLGFITLNTPDGTAEIFIDDKQSSLRGIAAAINAEPKSPIRAAVIKDASEDTDKWKIIFSGKKEGSENDIEFPEFYFLDGAQDFYIDHNKPAKNALITVDGFQIETDSNDIQDFMPGVNLHLKGARPDQPFEIKITEDFQKISGKVKGLVDQLNGILGWINKQNQVDEKSDTRTTFAGDTSLQTIEYRLRNLFHDGFPVGDFDNGDIRFVRMGEIGIEFDRQGNLTFKEDKFTKYMEKDFETLSQVISGPYGVAGSLKQVIDGYTNFGTGALSLKEKGFRDRIKDIDGQIDMRQKMLDRKQQSLVDQFSRLGASLANLQRQQQYLGAMGAGGGGGNMVSQLLGG